MRAILSAIGLVLIIAASGIAQQSQNVASWVSIQPEDTAPNTVVYHKSFDLDFNPDEAYLKFTCYTPMDFGGTHYRAYVNGIAGPECSYWKDAQYMNVSQVLRSGTNGIDIEVTWIDKGTPGPVLAKLTVKGKDKKDKEKSVVIRTDASWTYTTGTLSGRTKGNSGPLKSVTVAGAADAWEPAVNPQVLPKISTSTVVGVTNVKMKSGNAGSLFQFENLRDYSDKYYFLKSMGFFTMEDYIYGQVNYQFPGQWFWGYDKLIARSLGRAGMKLAVYPWVWVPAQWFCERQKPTMIKCLTHDEDGFGISIWSPELLKLNEDMYADMKENIGESIAELFPGIYGDFGECHYMAGWNPWMQPVPEHQHPDFWVGDDAAKADFRSKMLAKYGSVDKINAVWNTHFSLDNDICYPKLDGSDPHRYALDFVNWYYGCMTDFTLKVCSIAKKQFPDIPVAPKLGCGDENPMWGQDNSAIPEALAKIGVGICSTHGSSPNFAVRRLSSACKFYGNAFETETAGGTNRAEAAKKFFIDASCGCSSVFEYPDALLSVADIFSRVRRQMRGEHSLTPIALFFPTSWHRCNLRQGYPQKLTAAAEEIRDITDFDIVDENMILDGALEHYRVLAMFDGDFMEQAAYDKIQDWVNRGGTLVMRDEELPYESVEGVSLTPQDLIDEARSGGAVRAVGDGQMMIWSGNWDDRQDYYELIYDAACPSSDGIDGRSDGVWTSLFKNRAIYLNNSDSSVTISEELSEDFAHRMNLTYNPGLLKYNLEIPARSIGSHSFDRRDTEITLECEKMSLPKKVRMKAVYRGGYGTLGMAVLLSGCDRLETAFSINESGDYGICCLADSMGGKASLEIDGRWIADICQPPISSRNIFPICAKMPLKKGRHTVSIIADGLVSADKVIITSDTGLAGFAYGYMNLQVDQGW